MCVFDEEIEVTSRGILIDKDQVILLCVQYLKKQRQDEANVYKTFHIGFIMMKWQQWQRNRDVVKST